MVAERQLLYGKRVFGLSFFFPNNSPYFKREKCNFL